MKTNKQLALELRSMANLVIGREFFKLWDAMGTESYLEMVNAICRKVWPEHLERFNNPELLMSDIWGPSKEAIRMEFETDYLLHARKAMIGHRHQSMEPNPLWVKHSH